MLKRANKQRRGTTLRYWNTSILSQHQEAKQWHRPKGLSKLFVTVVRESTLLLVIKDGDRNDQNPGEGFFFNPSHLRLRNNHQVTNITFSDPISSHLNNLDAPVTNMMPFRLPFTSILGLLLSFGNVNCQPVNDNCAQARPLVINGPPQTGTSVDATKELLENDVVFSFVGNGRTVRISTCFDATDTAHTFLVRNGGCSYGSLGTSTSDPTCLSNVNAAALEFDSIKGRVYPIVVGLSETNAPGSFAIQVTDYANPPNDYCAQSQPLVINNSPILGSTVNATKEYWDDDVVYSFVGTGETLRVTTCFDGTDTPHRFFIRNGGCSYGSLGIAVSDPACLSNANAAALEFDSVKGRAYPIIVAPSQQGVEGNFAIQVTSYNNPNNDYCAQAQPLIINGSPAFGSTVNATKEHWDDDVVYSVVGTGETLRVTTCHDGTDSPHRFFIRNGGCSYGSLGIAVSDPTCLSNPNAAVLEFDSVEGRVYPIIVAPSQQGVEGSFAIQVASYKNPSNDYCPEAQPLIINGPPVLGSTVNATKEYWDDDVVYSFVGTGETLRVTTCFDGTDTPHRFFIRNGGCSYGSLGIAVSDPTCLSNANAAALELDSVEGRVYPIIVAPRQEGVEGNFVIAVRVPGAPTPPPIPSLPVNSVDGPTPPPVTTPSRAPLQPVVPPPLDNPPSLQMCGSRSVFGGMLMDVIGAQADYVVTACESDQDGGLSNLAGRGWEGLKICPTGSCDVWDAVAGCATILGDTSQYGNWSPDQWTACPGQILNTFIACTEAGSSVLVVKATTGALEVTMKGCESWATAVETGSCMNGIGTMSLDDTTPWVTFKPSTDQNTATVVESLLSKASGYFMLYAFAMVAFVCLALVE